MPACLGRDMARRWNATQFPLNLLSPEDIMKSSFSFKLANIKVEGMAEIGEFSVAAEVEFTEAEYMALIAQAGNFYEWLGEKIEPVMAFGMAKVMEEMEKNAVAEESPFP